MGRIPALLAVMSVALTAQSRLVEGNANSLVRVVIYEDLQCPDCANFRQMLDRHLLPAYAAKVAFDHRDFPLPKHNWARKAAVAARYFETVRPALAVEYRRQTMATLKQITLDNFDQRLADFAKANSLDPAKAIAAVSEPKLAALVEDDYQEGIARGVGKTPTVFVGDTPFIETFSVEEISKAIAAAVKEAGR